MTDSPRRRGDRRDRHGRHRRALSDPRRRPGDGHRTPDRARFARLVGEATALLPEAVLAELSSVDLLVVDVPPPAPRAAPEVSLAACVTSARGTELVLHRRPLEARAGSKSDLVGLIAAVIIDHLADHLGWDDQDLEDRGWEPPGP